MSKEASEEYNLRASRDAVGYLYPTIVDKHDRIIDGQHRLELDPKWPCFRLSHIDSLSKFLMARIIANVHRRQVSAEEKSQWLAELQQETGWNTEQISEKLGMSPSWVKKYLPERLKNQEKVAAGKRGGEKKSATRRVASQLSEVRQKPPPGFHIVKDGENTDRFLTGLENLYFLKPGDKLTAALVDCCTRRKIHWSIPVIEGLKLFFSSQGIEL